MSILIIISEIILNTAIFYIVFLISKIKLQNTYKKKILAVEEKPNKDIPSYSWAKSNTEISHQEDMILVDKFSINLSNLVLNFILIFLLAGSFFIIELFKLKYSIIYFIFIFIAFFLYFILTNLDKIFKQNFYSIKENLKRIFFVNLNFFKNNEFYNYKEITFNLKYTLKLQDKYNIIFSIILSIFLYLDLFIAKVSLDINSATAYIFISTLCKIFIVTIYFLFKSILNKENKLLFSLLLYILYSVTFYVLFNFSQIILKFISIDLFTIFHTALPFIFISNILSFSILKFLYLQQNHLSKSEQTKDITFYSVIIISLISIFMLTFFYTNSLETVSFFISGISLVILTLFYHLFYRLNTYIQMV